MADDATKDPAIISMQGGDHTRPTKDSNGEGAALSSKSTDRPALARGSTNAPATREPHNPLMNNVATGEDGPNSPFFQLVQYPEVNKTVGKFNQHFINISEGGSFGTVPHLVINTADPLWGCVVSGAVQTAFVEGKSTVEVIKCGAKAATFVNQQIANGESPPPSIY